MYDSLTFAQDRNGVVWACDLPNSNARCFVSKPILAPGHEYHNLFAASALLYRVNKDTQATLERAIELCEALELDHMVQALQQSASSLKVAARCAEEGLREVL